nr:hypothetical protein [Tanacetum cinerariifolium]
MLRYTGGPSSAASPGGAAPIAMAWRHHDSSVADPFPKPSEYNTSDVAKIREVVIALCKLYPSLLYVAGLSHVWKHAGRSFSLKILKGRVIPSFFLTMVEFLQLPDFKGCKVTAGEILSPSLARVTHLSNPVDIPPKTKDMVVVEIPCRKVLDDKEKKKRKADVKVVANVPSANIQAERVAGKEGARKKRRVHVGTLVHPDSKYVSSPIFLNHAKPLEILANEEYVSPNASVGRMGQHPEIIEKPLRDKFEPDVKANDNLPFTPQWGFTDSCRMDNSRMCRDMMLNLFTPVDHDFFNEGVRDESAIKRGLHPREKLADILEELEEEKKEMEQLDTEQADRIKQLEDALRQYEAMLIN